MKLSDLHARINDLQFRIDDLRNRSQDPSESLKVAMEELSTALEELDVAQEELCQQDEDLQTAYLKIESEHRRYLELFDYAPDGCLVTDLKGIVKEANLAATELLQSMLLGRNISDFLGSEYRDEFNASLPRLKDGTIIHNWEAHVMPTRGAVVPVLISANATHDIHCNPDGLRWQFHDITRRKNAEKALQESEKKYRLLIENANEAIIVAQDGLLRFVNPKFLEITGCSKEEMESKPFTEIIHPDDRKMVAENHLRRLNDESAPENYAFRIIDKSGAIKWLEINPVKISWMGRPATLNFLSDITVRKIAEERLRLFESVVANANDGVVIIASDQSCLSNHTIEYVNQAFEKMTGYGEEELIGKHPGILDHLNLDPAAMDRIRKAVSKNEPVRLEKISCHKDGTRSWSEISMFPVRDENGESSHWVSIERDTTVRHSYEEELGASREKYRNIVENIYEAIYSLDDRGVITYISPSIERISGYLPEEITGRHFEEFVSEEDKNSQKELFSKIFSGEACEYSEFRIPTVPGNIKWIHNSIRPTLKDGRVTSISGVLTDITERKRAESALRENLNFLQMLMDTVPAPIFYKNLKGRYLGCNRAFEDLMGMKRSEIMGLSVHDLMPREMADKHHEKDLALLSCSGIQVYETQFCDVKGVSHDFILNKATYTDERGDVAGIVGVLMDITGRKQAEKALNESLNFLQRLMDAIPNSIFYKSPSGLYLGCNNAFEAYLGLKREEIIGKSVYDLSPRELADKQHEMDQALLTSPGAQAYETSVHHADGTEHDVIISKATYIDTDGTVAGIVGVILDITERKKAEQETKEREAELAAIYENAPLIMMLIDGERRVRKVNKSAEIFTGTTGANMIGLRGGEALRCLHYLDDPRGCGFGPKCQDCTVRNAVMGTIETGQSLHQVEATRPFSVDGMPQEITFLLSTARLNIQGENQVLVTIQDITRRKRAEEELREAKEYAENLIETANVIVLGLDAEGKINVFNGAAEKITGYSRAEMIGESWEIVLPRSRYEFVWKEFDRLKQGGFHKNYENPILTKSGEERNIVWQNNEVLELGRTVGSISFGMDITDRKRAEEDLRREREKYQNIFENSILGLYQSTPDGRLLNVNPAFARLFGYNSPEEMVASVTDIGYQLYANPQDRDRTIKQIAERGFMEGLEIEAQRNDGTRFWISMNARIVKEGDEKHFDGTVEDITKRKLAEEALQESKDYLDKIINSIGDPIFVKDRQHRMVLVNDAECALTGYSREETIGKTDYDFFPKEQVDVFWEMDEVVFNTGNENVNEEEITDIQGNTHSVITKKTLYTDLTGNKFLVGAIRDITDRKLAEEKIRSAYRQVLEIVEFLPDATFVIDKDKKVIAWNKAIEDLTGVPKSEILGKSDHAYATPFYGTPGPILIDLLEDPDIECSDRYSHMERKGDTVYAEIYMPESSGRPGAYLWAKASPLIDYDGNHVGAIESIRDITERKMIEESLSKSERKYRSIVELTKDGVILIDESGHIVEWNAGAERISGLNRHEAMGMPIWEVLFSLIPDDLKFPGLTDSVRDKTIEMLRTGQIPEKNRLGEYRVQRTDRALLIVEEALSAIPTEKGFMICSNMRDITGRKLAEETRERLVSELETKNTEMERFIYTVSHDLRSPLVTVNGFVGILKSDIAKGNSERIELDLRMISTAVSKMDRLLSDTLQLSRVGRVVNPPSVVPFTEIVSEAIDLVSEKIRVKGARVSIEPDLPLVNVDKMRIVEVLTNLIENSVKYMGDPPCPEIKIGCRLDGDENVFFVKDNGIGMDPSQHEKVFGLFYKVNNKSEGSGAGLAIVKRIIEVHGGRIWIESLQGMGCTVCFTLPEPKGAM